jgi:ABC-2 type transport system permease protein
MSLSAYGGDYFPFVLIGMAVSCYQGAGLKIITESMREEQSAGTLEPVFSTPISPLSFLLASSQWDFLQVTFEVIVYLASGFLFFGLRFPSANLFGALLILLLALCAFATLGLFSAAFILKFKRGDPAAWLISTVSELLGGVYFPLSVLPGWLRPVSVLIPMTPALEGLRQTLIRGSSIREILPQLLYLSAFSILLMPLGLLAFRQALRAVKREGSLGHY